MKGKAAASFLANSSDIVTEFLVGYTLFLLLTLFFINIVVYMIKRAVTNTVKDNVAHIRGETEEMFYGMTGGGNAQQLVNRSLNLAEQRMHQSMDQAEQRMHQATYGLFGTNHDPNRTLGSRLNHLFVKKNIVNIRDYALNNYLICLYYEEDQMSGPHHQLNEILRLNCSNHRFRFNSYVGIYTFDFNKYIIQKVMVKP